MTKTQRELFGEVVTEERRAELIERCYHNAVSLDASDAASYMKLMFSYLFGLPKPEQDADVVRPEDVLTPEVCEHTWEEIKKQVRWEDAEDARRRKQNVSRSTEAQ